MVVKYLKRFAGLVSIGITTIQNRGLDRTFLLTIRFLSSKLRFHDRVSNCPILVTRAITSATLYWTLCTVRLFHNLFPQKYTTADPYEVIYVDPNQIKHISGNHDKKRRGWVVDGDWDKNGKRFLDLPIPAAIKEHYMEGKEWEETTLYDHYSDKDSFKEKCQKIENLYDQITANGFHSQKELVRSDPKKAYPSVNATMSPRTNEITIDIGRDGELLWNMLGKHRLSIAKVADVDTVPVLVFTRHRQWEQTRNEYQYSEQNRDTSRQHPDLCHCPPQS